MNQRRQPFPTRKTGACVEDWQHQHGDCRQSKPTLERQSPVLQIGFVRSDIATVVVQCQLADDTRDECQDDGQVFRRLEHIHPGVSDAHQKNDRQG